MLLSIDPGLGVGTLLIILFIILFITGFIPTLFDDHFLTGLPLIIHVTAAPVFALSLAILILFYSFKLKLNQNDFNNLVQGKNLIKINATTVIKISFWLLTLFSVPLLLSIILILFPILGTEIQEINIMIHRLSATIITIACMLMLYSIILTNKDVK